MQPRPFKEQIEDLVTGISAETMRNFGLASLQRWRKRFPNERVVDIRDIGLYMLADLGTARGYPRTPDNGLKEGFLEFLGEPFMAGLLEFVSWLVSAGFVLPYVHHAPSGAPFKFWLTERGDMLTKLPDAEHPLLPRFVERLVERCPGLPADAVGLLHDASACLDRALLRPAVVVLGVAYEVVVDAVLRSRADNDGAAAKALEFDAAKRIAGLREMAPRIFDKSQKAARFAFLHACDFADLLRERRNDGSHVIARYGFGDRAEVEEFIVSAGRHLPNLWAPTGTATPA